MRDLVLLAGLLVLIPMIFKRPFVGVLVWTWIALLNPHREAFGFSSSLRPNLLIVLVTLLAFAFSSEPKKWPGGALAMNFAAFMVWTTICLIVAPDPETSFVFYNDFVIKMAIHMAILLVLINSAHRLIALVWTYALSLGYHAVKIGLVTIKSGGIIGSYTGFGPADTMLEDRNHFALAMLMLLPILFFLWKHASQKIMRSAALMGMIMSVLSVIGSFSRGGLITMAAMGLFLWTKTRNKLVSGTMFALLAFGALSMVPQEYKERIGTAFEQFDSGGNYADEEDQKLDESFCLRVAVWQIGLDMTLASPIFGNGLRSIQNHDVAGNYTSSAHVCSDAEKYGPRAAHNIYVEVMTDSGFVGLGLFLSILIGSWLACTRIAMRTRKKPELTWAHDLARMLQVSITGYAIGGGLLSLAYFDGYFLLVMMVVVLGRLVDEELGAKEPRRAISVRAASRRAKAKAGGGRRPKPA